MAEPTTDAGGGGMGLNMSWKGDSKSEKNAPNSLSANASVNGGTFTGPTITKGITGGQIVLGLCALALAVVFLYPKGGPYGVGNR